MPTMLQGQGLEMQPSTHCIIWTPCPLHILHITTSESEPSDHRKKWFRIRNSHDRCHEEKGGEQTVPHQLTDSFMIKIIQI